jgi:AraC family transcriptional regulator
MQIEIEQLQPMRVGVVRHVGPYNQIGAAFQRLGQIAGAAGLFETEGAVMLGIYDDDPRQTPAEQLRSAAAIAVKDGTQLPDGLAEATVPGGRYARATHVGAYEELPHAWEEFTASLGSTGERVGQGPGLEVYRSDMSSTPKEQLRTDLYLPLEVTRE